MGLIKLLKFIFFMKINIKIKPAIDAKKSVKNILMHNKNGKRK